jgi:GAF domain-containing protein
MLQSLTATLSRLRDVREIGEAIVNELRLLIDYHTCRVYLVDGHEARPIAFRGDLGSADGAAIEPPPVRLGEGITGYVAATGEPLLVENALDSLFAAQIPGTERVDESVVAAPLRDGTRIVGVVFLSKLGVGQFDEDDLRLLEVLSGHVGVVLDNARLYEQTKREAENARAWLEFADALSAAEGLEAMCAEAVKRVAGLLEVEKCALWLQEEPSGAFVCAAADGYAGDPDAEPVIAKPVPREEGDRLLGDRKTPFVLTIEELRTFAGSAQGLKLRPVACAPLPPGFGVRGWISVREPNDDLSRFTDTRLRLLDGMAYRVSMALQRRALVQQLQESADGANALLEFSRALAHSRDEADALRRSAALVATILEMQRAYVLLEDAISGDLYAGARFGTDDDHELRFPGPAVRDLLLARDGAFVLSTDEIDRALGAKRAIVPVAVARLSLPGGRLGCLVVAARDPGCEFDERSLWLLEGMAYQATLALSR